MERQRWRRRASGQKVRPGTVERADTARLLVTSVSRIRPLPVTLVLCRFPQAERVPELTSRRRETGTRPDQQRLPETLDGVAVPQESVALGGAPLDPDEPHQADGGVTGRLKIRF